jgi:hypothetical protein
MPEPKNEKDPKDLPDGCRMLVQGCAGGCTIGVFLIAFGMWAAFATAAAILN